MTLNEIGSTWVFVQVAPHLPYLDALQAKMDALNRLMSETGAELDVLMPAVLDRAFKGELL